MRASEIHLGHQYFFSALCVIGLILYGSFAGPASAADLSAVAAVPLAPIAPVPPIWSLYEFRVGAFAHGVGFLGPGIESGSADLNAEFLTPRLQLLQDSFWGLFVPRAQIGGMLNFAGKTSYAFAGAAWTVDFGKWFFEPMFGVAFHDGDLTAPIGSGRLSLGCSPLFHTGVTFGYRLSEHWDIMATWDHISNGGLCSSNPGVNEYGVKIGYLF